MIGNIRAVRYLNLFVLKVNELEGQGLNLCKSIYINVKLTTNNLPYEKNYNKY